MHSSIQIKDNRQIKLKRNEVTTTMKESFLEKCKIETCQNKNYSCPENCPENC